MAPDPLAGLLTALAAGDDAQCEAAIAGLARLEGEARQTAIESLRRLIGLPFQAAADGPTPAAAGCDAGAQPAPSAPDEQRWWAGRALAELGDGEALAALLDDPEAALRQCAALGLRGHPHPDALDALARGLHDPDALTARLAADALVALGPQAAPALIAALQHGPHTVKLHAVRALAQLKDPSSIPALFEALSQDSALLEYWASEGLDNMGVGTSFFLPGS
jgi:HEAT repeat protein